MPRGTLQRVPAGPQMPDAGAYVAAYKREFGRSPAVWGGAFTYDSAWLLFRAMTQAGTTACGPLLDAVLQTEGMQGVTGTIDIHARSRNRAHAPVFILRVKRSGTFVIED